MTTRYFCPANDTPRIHLCRNPVDFRKASAGPAAIVERELGHNPFDGGLYAFTNRRRNKVPHTPKALGQHSIDELCGLLLHRFRQPGVNRRGFGRVVA